MKTTVPCNQGAEAAPKRYQTDALAKGATNPRGGKDGKAAQRHEDGHDVCGHERSPGGLH